MPASKSIGFASASEPYNVTPSLEGNKLTIVIDMDVEPTMSSNDNPFVATTRGNRIVPLGRYGDFKLSLNLAKK